MALATLAKDRPVLSTAVLGLSAVCVLKTVRSLLKKPGPGEEVPWASGWRPIVGHLFVMLKWMKDNNKLAAGRMAISVKAEEGHDIFKIGMFGMCFTVLTDLEAIEEVVTNDPKRFTKNFDGVPAFKYTKELFGNGLFFANTDSDDWSVAHGILKAPFSVQGVKTVFPMMCEQADLLVKCLKKEVGYGGVCHIDHWVTKMAIETIAVCATGTSFGSFGDDQDCSFIKALNECISEFGVMVKWPWQLWPLLFRGNLARMRERASFMRSTCMEIIRRRRAKETRHISDKRDIMDMMLEDKDPRSGKAMSEKQIVDNVFTFLLAGQDSTAAAMASLMCFLHANPRCKERLTEEIDSVVGSSQLEWDHLSRLPYLDWCIKETLRLVPPAGAVVRTANGDQLLQNRWRIPHGSMVMVGIMAVHYDKKIWGEDACEFRPERWESGPPHKYAFMPFAIGPRACTGREFTVVEQKITFVKLLQHFDFRRPADVKAEPGYTTLKKEDQTMVPFIDMDIEYKTTSAFVGLFSAFELLERKR